VVAHSSVDAVEHNNAQAMDSCLPIFTRAPQAPIDRRPAPCCFHSKAESLRLELPRRRFVTVPRACALYAKHMTENNLVEHPVPGPLRIASVKRCMHPLACWPGTAKSVRFDPVSDRFAPHAMQMGNTAKHILTCRRTIVQFSQQ